MQYFLTCSKLEIKLLISKLIKVNFFFAKTDLITGSILKKYLPRYLLSSHLSKTIFLFLSSLSLSTSLRAHQSSGIRGDDGGEKIFPEEWVREMPQLSPGKNEDDQKRKGVSKKKEQWSRVDKLDDTHDVTMREYTYLVCDDMTSTCMAKY